MRVYEVQPGSGQPVIYTLVATTMTQSQSYADPDDSTTFLQVAQLAVRTWFLFYFD